MELNVRVIPHAIAESYCERLITDLSQHLTPAMFWTNGVRVHDPKIRDAYNYKFQDQKLTETTGRVVSEISAAHIDIARIEPMEIVCYPPGNGNERHLDGPHRSHSIVYFLNRGYDGGELIFDDGRVFRDMPPGTAVVWENGPEAWHACGPITRGFKWIIVSWVRRPDALETEAEIHAHLREVNEAAARSNIDPV